MSRSNMFSIDIERGIGGSEFARQSSRLLGRITVGDFTESFHMALDFWSPRDYRASWKRALGRLLSADVIDSCLIASVGDPETANFVTCWPLYRRKEKVYVQNSIIFLDQLEGGFDPDRPWEFIEARQSIDEDGNRVSEWETEISEVEEFLRTVDW